jgi:hypothetical protein
MDFHVRFSIFEGMTQKQTKLSFSLIQVAFWSAILQTTGCRWRVRVCAIGPHLFTDLPVEIVVISHCNLTKGLEDTGTMPGQFFGFGLVAKVEVFETKLKSHQTKVADTLW